MSSCHPHRQSCASDLRTTCVPDSLVWLQTRLPCSVMPQDHFNYAATWWTLSAATLALAVKAIRQGVKAR